jgi:hypothetical protein
MPLTIIDGPTIRLGESLSEGVDCSAGTIVRITVPQEFTPSNLTFKVSSNGDLYNDLFNSNGEEVTIVAKPDSSIVVSAQWARTVGFIQIRSGTREHPVEQVKDDCRFAVAVETADAPAAAASSKPKE